MRNEGNVRDPGRKTIIDLRWRRFGRERRRESHIFPFFFSFFCPSPVFLFPRSRRLKEKLIARGIYGLRHKKKQNFMVENFRFAIRSIRAMNKHVFFFFFLLFIIYLISSRKAGRNEKLGGRNSTIDLEQCFAIIADYVYTCISLFQTIFVGERAAKTNTHIHKNNIFR